MMQSKHNICGMTFSELESIAGKHGWPGFTARQIAEWTYKKRVRSFDAMQNISKRIRQELERHYALGCSEPVDTRPSTDGTKKYLFQTTRGNYIESAYIPEGNRHTLCISSQAGCRMGCRFCMTGRQGLHQHLQAGEMINQVCSIPEASLLTNIVYMGMGEPLDNLAPVLKSLEVLTAEYGMAMSPRRITVSTIGLLPGLDTLLHQSNCHIAVSMHSPFPDERRQLVPAEKRHPLTTILDRIREHPIEKQRRISMEYIVFRDFNHSRQHVKAIARLLQGMRCRINLIRYHPIPGSALAPPDEEHLQEFRAGLERKGLVCTIRKSRGLDIQAACGLLSTKEMHNKGQLE